MSDLIVQQDIATLLNGWIKAEKNGASFPVSFDLAWGVVGYSTKGNAKRKLTSAKSQLIEGVDYLIRSDKSLLDGRLPDSIDLTSDAFKQFCMMAETDQGRGIRQYFIESEKKWNLVQEVAPQFSQEIEALQFRREIAQIEAQKAELELRKSEVDRDMMLFRDTVLKLQPPGVADRILGVTTIEKIEIRTKIVDENDRILNAANTVTKTELAHRYGFITKTGKADTKLVTNLIDEAILSGAISQPWHDVRVVTAPGFDASLIPVLDQFFQANPVQRQRWMGEN